MTPWLAFTLGFVLCIILEGLLVLVAWFLVFFLGNRR